MALKKACCCSSAETGALLFSYLVLICSAWSLLNTLIDWENRINLVFWKEYPYIYNVGVCFDLIGIFIFLPIVVSIDNKNTPSVFLLNAAIAFLSSHVIYIAYYKLKFTGEIDNLMDAYIDEEVRKLRVPLYAQEEFRSVLKQHYLYPTLISMQLAYLYMAIKIFIDLYALLVFHCYKIELKENRVDVVPVRKNVAHK